MTPRRSATSWLRLGLALLALLGSPALHDLLHAHASGEAPSGRIEAHGGACEHQPESPPHDARTCAQCKGGRAEALAFAHPAPHAAAPPSDRGVLLRIALDLPSSTDIPGLLGARGPPTAG